MCEVDGDEREENSTCGILKNNLRMNVIFWPLAPGLKMLFQGNTLEGSDTFQRPVIERDRVGGLRLMIWEKVKVPFCHYSHALEERGSSENPDGVDPNIRRTTQRDGHNSGVKI